MFDVAAAVGPRTPLLDDPSASLAGESLSAYARVYGFVGWTAE